MATSDLIHPTPTTADVVHSQTSQPPALETIEEMTNELKRLLVKHEHMLDEEGIKPRVETIERWMESYRRGIAAAQKISETGLVWLEELRNHLRLSADELQRLEAEGGNPASKEQVEKTEELLKAVKRLEKMMPHIEQLFKCEAPCEEAGHA